MRRSFLGLLCAALMAAAPDTAMAGGFEYPAAGAIPLGRGGAYHARANTPLALLYNPANLAEATGIQLELDANIALYQACFRRNGGYLDTGAPAFPSDSRFGDSDEVAAAGIEYPRVCNSGPPGIVPELAFSWRINPMFGVGVGLLAPAAVGHTVWGRSRDGTVRAPDGTTIGGTPVDRLPSPMRYNLVEEQLLLAYPTIGVAVSPHKTIRFGATFGWGFGIFDFRSVTRPTAGEDFGLDIFSELHAVDTFVPRVGASVAVTPHPNLDIMAGFTWTQDVNADGHIDLQAQTYRDVEQADPSDTLCTETGSAMNAANRRACRVDDAELTAPQPWQLQFGLRYADRITPRARDAAQVGRLSNRIEDYMSNERWDIELNVVYERNSEVETFRIQTPTRNAIEADTGLLATVPTQIGGCENLPEEDQDLCALGLQHGWQDQISVRLGGDYNLLPGMASVRAGVSYETRGVKQQLAQIDFTPFMRVGIHAGLTIRLGKLDISLAYAHIFQETLTVDRLEETAGIDDIAVTQVTASRAAGDPTVINAGKYTANYDVLSLSLNYHIR